MGGSPGNRRLRPVRWSGRVVQAGCDLETDRGRPKHDGPGAPTIGWGQHHEEVVSPRGEDRPQVMFNRMLVGGRFSRG